MAREIIRRVWERGFGWGSGMAAQREVKGKNTCSAEPRNIPLCQVEPEAQEHWGEVSVLSPPPVTGENRETKTGHACPL